MQVSPIAYVIFVVFVLAMLALDLGVFHRTPHKVSIKESVVWTVVWVALALVFNAGVWYFMGPQAGSEFLGGYLLEKALSVENIMIFVIIFQVFRIPQELQHRVLFFGILGALVMRALFIAAGAVIIAKFQWALYLFGVFLLFTAIKMLWLAKQDNEGSGVVTWVSKVLPMSLNSATPKFFVNENGKRLVTPLLGALIAIEVSDVIFALDSVPAIFAITSNPFIVFTSNIFAILGLRSLYFASAHVIEKFHYLKTGVAVILLWIAAKLLLHGFVAIPIAVTLGVIFVVVAVSVVLSMRRAKFSKSE